MINMDQFLPLYPLSMALIVLALAVHGWFKKNWHYLWLLVFVFINQFVPLIESVTILLSSFFLLPKKTRIVSSLLITFSLLAPAEVKGFFYLALVFWQLEYFLSGPSSEKLDESLPILIFLYFSKQYLGPQIDLVANYLLIFASLRMLFFVRSSHQVLISFYFLLMSLALLTNDSTHSLLAIATAGGVLLHFADNALKSRSLEGSLTGSFYERPKYLALALVSWIGGPAFLLSGLLLASPLYIAPVACLLIMICYRALKMFTTSRVIGEGNVAPVLEHKYLVGLFSYSLISFLLSFNQLRFVNIASTFIIWGVALVLIAIAYGLLKFFIKSDAMINEKVTELGNFVSNYQHTLDYELNSSLVTEGRSTSKSVLNKLIFSAEIFVFPVVIFFIIMIGLIVLMGEMQV